MAPPILTAHRRASRPADARSRGGAAGGPGGGTGAATRAARRTRGRTIGRLDAASETTWTADAAQPAGTADAAQPAGTADAAVPGTAWTADAAWPADATDAAGTTWAADAAWPAHTADAAGPAWPANAADTPGSANAGGTTDAARAAWTTNPSWPPGTAGPRLAAHAGPIVRVRPPRLQVVADVDAIPDIDVSVVDIAAPARIAGPDRRIDRARSPVPVVVVPQRADRDAGPETEKRRDAGIGLIDRDRVVGGDVDRRRVGRLDFDVRRLSAPPARGRDRLLDGRDRLLRGRLKSAVLLRLGAKLLDDVGDVLGLVHFSVAEVCRPVEILAHHLDSVRKASERLHRRIPILIVDPGIIVVRDARPCSCQPALRLDDLHRVGAGGQKLRQQGIRIERDRGEQLFEFGAAEAFYGRWLCGVRPCVGRRRGRGRGRIVLRLCQGRLRDQRHCQNESE